MHWTHAINFLFPSMSFFNKIIDKTRIGGSRTPQHHQIPPESSPATTTIESNTRSSNPYIDGRYFRHTSEPSTAIDHHQVLSTTSTSTQHIATPDGHSNDSSSLSSRLSNHVSKPSGIKEDIFVMWSRCLRYYRTSQCTAIDRATRLEWLHMKQDLMPLHLTCAYPWLSLRSSG